MPNDAISADEGGVIVINPAEVRDIREGWPLDRILAHTIEIEQLRAEMRGDPVETPIDEPEEESVATCHNRRNYSSARRKTGDAR